MSEKLPRITAAEIIKVLRTTIPFHGKKTLHPKTLRSILNEADLSIEQLKKLL